MEAQIDVDEICRLCLRSKMLGMILLQINEIQQSKFEEITSCQLVLDEGYPSRCCSDCRDQLENFYFYKNQLLRKQDELLQVLQLPLSALQPPIYPKQIDLITYQEADEADQEQPIEFTKEDEVFSEEDEEVVEVSESEYFDEEILEEIAADGEFSVVDPYEEIEVIEGEIEESEPCEKVPRIDEVKFEKTKPLLVLSPSFLKARESLKNIQPSEQTPNLDYRKSEGIDGKTSFICSSVECQAELPSEEEMKLHLLDHKFDLRRQKCPHCSHTFKSRYFYEKHIETSHNQPVHICQICGKILDSKIQLRSHLRNHDQTLRYKCTFEGCQKAFRVKHHLSNHMRGHTNESPFACSFEGCSAKFRQKHALTIHMRKHKGEFLTCDQCKSPFVTKFHLSKHLEKCNGVFKPLKTRVMSKLTNLESSSEVFRCCIETCEENFKAKVTLEKHLTKVHEVRLTPTTCILCCIEFPTQKSLKLHQRLHLPFTCPFCSANFKNKETYLNHLKNHSDNEVRSHQCTECQASFKRAEHLRSHVTYKHSSDLKNALNKF